MGKELSAALGDCNTALQMSPYDADVLSSRGFVRLKMGDLKAALSDFDQAIGENSELSTALFMRSVVKRRLGDMTGAEIDLAAAQKLDPDVANESADLGIAPER